MYTYVHIYIPKRKWSFWTDSIWCVWKKRTHYISLCLPPLHLLLQLISLFLFSFPWRQRFLLPVRVWGQVAISTHTHSKTQTQTHTRMHACAGVNMLTHIHTYTRREPVVEMPIFCCPHFFFDPAVSLVLDFKSPNLPPQTDARAQQKKKSNSSPREPEEGQVGFWGVFPIFSTHVKRSAPSHIWIPEIFIRMGRRWSRWRAAASGIKPLRLPRARGHSIRCRRAQRTSIDDAVWIVHVSGHLH